MAAPPASGSKARVLCVTTYELSERSASTRALNVAAALRDLGHEVTIHQHVTRRRYLPQGIVAERSEAIRRKVIVSPRAASFVRHYSAVVRGNYDVVIGNNMNGAFYSLLGRLRAPLILDLHGDMVAELDMFRPDPESRPSAGFRVRRIVYQLTESTTRRLSSRISCVSRTMVSELRQRGVPPERLLYVPNCVDLDFFKPKAGPDIDALRSRLGIAPEKLVLGYLGRAHPWQGVDQFIEAARETDDPDLAFVIVGTDETKTEGNLHFAGEASLSEMRDYYAICDVFVLPRPSHPATEVAAPTKFAEYSAMGKPIIATQVGDAPDLIREYECGIVVNDNSPAELLRGFRQMRDATAEERSAMGRKARQLAEVEFNLDIARESLSRCIDELTAGNERRTA